MRKFISVSKVLSNKFSVNKPTLSFVSKTQNRFYSDHSGEKDTSLSHAGSFLKKEEVTERVINVIKQHSRLGVAPEQISQESHFANDLKLDSLDTTEIVMEIEDEFVIEIPDKEAYSFNTVGEVINYICQHPMAK